MENNIRAWIIIQCLHCKRWFAIHATPDYTLTEVAKLREYCPYCSKKKNKRVMTIRDYQKKI